jgi:hypothetical protein
MSQTSKVNPCLRTRILEVLASGVSAGNGWLEYYLRDRYTLYYSTRAIQEATQKMTADGTLTKTKAGRYTFYTIASQTPMAASVGI